MVAATRVNYYIVIAGGVLSIVYGLGSLYVYFTPPHYILLPERLLIIGLFFVSAGLYLLYKALRSEGHISFSKGGISYPEQ